jgi:DNA-binding transcriptional MerR regulator
MLTIGQLAGRADMTADAIRFYEREGLLAPASRSAAGYRLYDHGAVRRLGFIRHAQQCGFSLGEIKELLELRGRNRACCDDVYRVAVEKKLELEAKIRALKTMSEALSALIDACSHDAKPLEDCPIVGALESSLARQRARSATA